MQTDRSTRRFGRTAVAGLAIASLAAGAALLSRGAAVQPETRGDNGCGRQLRELRENPRNMENRKFTVSCVDSTDMTRRRAAHRRINFDRARLADIHSMIPEYHDEQRLSAGPGLALGPQAGIYVSPHLDDFTRVSQFTEHGADGVLVAYVVVSRVNNEPLPTTYSELGLGFGLSCVYLVRTSDTAPWSGIVKYMKDGNSCDRKVVPVSTTPLEVVPNQDFSTNAADYPPVARFGESSTYAPLLGVKCLNAWCEMGKGPFTPLPPLKASLGTREAMIKGWHDEQFLSEPEWISRTAYVFKATPVRAAIIPVPGVEAIVESQFGVDWVTVGSIHLSQDPLPNSKYYRWGLRQGENKIALKYDPPASPTAPKVWHARMTTESGASLDWQFNKREEHKDVGILGTLRFRWTIADDGTWAPCGLACCQVEGPPQI